jgi:hypothetical protein
MKNWRLIKFTAELRSRKVLALWNFSWVNNHVQNQPDIVGIARWQKAGNFQ